MSLDGFIDLLEECIVKDINKHGSVEKFRDSIRVDGPTYDDMFGSQNLPILSNEISKCDKINKGIKV